jgi:uncharacterized damage-inducible protein DinB
MSNRTIEIDQSIDRYAAGPAELRAAIGNLTAEQVRTRVAPGRWSVLEVVCHLSDFELVYADRMKRILAEEKPTMFSGDPDQFEAALAYNQRDLEEELQVITAVRKQVTRLMRTLPAEAFAREGNHTADGPLSLLTLLKRIGGHIPHHAEFIRQKHQNL